MGRGIAELIRILEDMGSVLVAFSGGTDSSLLLLIAREVLGDKAVAVTAVSPVRPKEESDRAVRIARKTGARHILINTDELADEKVRFNDVKRCYYCKRNIFSGLLEIAWENNLAYVCDGSNIDDDNFYRPGMKAIKEMGIRSPLREAGMGKGSIRDISREKGLETWNISSESCFLTRFPYNKKIDPDLLGQLEKAEKGIKEMGFYSVRVRVYDDRTSIEVDQSQTGKICDENIRTVVIDAVRACGFRNVVIDLEGYTPGKMDIGLE